MLLRNLIVVLSIYFSIKHTVVASTSNDDIMAAINVLMDRINDVESHLMNRINNVDDAVKDRFKEVDKALEQVLHQNAVCENGCINRNCNVPNTSICDLGWTGEQCDKALCESGCTNGNCTAPNTCTCDIGWAGEQCDKALCESGCINGNCTAPDTCTCDLGWAGKQCDKECPESEGFFSTRNSDQCFKVDHERRSWFAAGRYCQDQDLVLASPLDHNAPFVMTYLAEKYGVGYYWVNARGTGMSMYRWGSDRSVLSNRSPLWRSGSPDQGGDRDDCLRLQATTGSGRPYEDYCCSCIQIYTICERLMG